MDANGFTKTHFPNDEPKQQAQYTILLLATLKNTRLFISLGNEGFSFISIGISVSIRISKRPLAKKALFLF
jgi:hypothetical protein